MLIDTGLSVPAFNVLKYFVISVFLEAIVRTSLNNFEVFFRALVIHRGQAVELRHSRKDRYWLLSTYRSHKNCPTVLVTTILAITAYAVEILLEFSSSAQEVQQALPGRLDLFQVSHPVCSPAQLQHEQTLQLVDDMASSCVYLHDKTYFFYNVSWQREDSSGPMPVCIHTRDNVLQTGNIIYSSLDYLNGSIEEKSLTDFRQTLHAKSWKSQGTGDQEVVMIRLSSRDLRSSTQYTNAGSVFTKAILLTKVSNTDIQCVGTAFGRQWAKIMSLRIYGCIRPIANGYNYIETPGASLIEIDARSIASSDWSTAVVVRTMTRMTDVYNFTKNVTSSKDIDEVIAFAILLSFGTGKSVDNINKYAVVYKHCAQYSVPQSGDVSRVQDFDKADSEKKITAFVYEWGLLLAVLWPLLLSLVSFCFYVWGRRKGLPTTLLGEGEIGQRWLSRSGDKTRRTADQSKPTNKDSTTIAGKLWAHCFSETNQVFLNVEIGELGDSIVVSSNPVTVERDIRCPFI